MRFVLCLLLWLTLPAAAVAGDLVVSVRTPQGAPVADAVVTVAAPHSGPIRFPWPYRMAQHHLQFDPFVLVVPVGADVAFPNLDPVRHQVYSFSPAKTFELKLYGRDETRVVRFDKPGVVAVGCNIHDNMVAFILVVETPYAAKTDALGMAVIHGAPAGAQAVRVWRPYLRARDNALTQTAQVPRDGQVRLTFTGDVRPPPEHHMMY
ncbi:MAG: methylamine utilization protein [Caulobacterales bacterium]